MEVASKMEALQREIDSARRTIRLFRLSLVGLAIWILIQVLAITCSTKPSHPVPAEKPP
jgi:hypothetical protein